MNFNQYLPTRTFNVEDSRSEYKGRPRIAQSIGRCFGMIAISLIICACQKEFSGNITPVPGKTVTIHFHGLVGSDPLVYGNAYANDFDEPFTVHQFKFYLHAIELRAADAEQGHYKGTDYYLIDFNDPSTSTINIEVPDGKYEELTFILGVDSARNVSGAQAGALDPAKGMFWTWNSGYIMAKLEGHSTFANNAAQKFEYHIGGFQGEFQVVQKISLSFALQPLDLGSGSSGGIVVNADVNRWFNGPTPITIATNPVCMTPGSLAKQVAQNYAAMFSIESTSIEP